MQLCNYGCGQEATYQFKNGKWCCSRSTNQCLYIKNKNSINSTGKKHSIKSIKKMSQSQIGKKHSEKTKQKIRESNIGRKHSEETKIKIGKSSTNRFFSQKTKLKMSKSQTGRKHSNKTKRKISLSNFGKKHSVKSKLKMSESSKRENLSIETRKKLAIANKLTITKIQKKYPTFAKIEEMRYNPDKPGEKEIQVHCKNHNCLNSKEQGGWFTPKYWQFDDRKRAIESENGNGGGYFYCSNKCKQECPLYNLRSDPFKTIEKLYTSQEYQTFRQYVLDREDEICEYCGEHANTVHHSRPQKLEPGFALDPDFGIACCESCHYKYGHKDECSTGNLATKICK